MKNRLFIIYFCFSLVLLLAACQRQQTNSSCLLAADRTTRPLPLNERDRMVYALAQLLGGNIDSNNRVFAEIIQSESYGNYRQELDTMWQQSSRTRLDPMSKWSSNELKDIHGTEHTLFYPFGGPDFLYAHTFFPYADDYVLFGLEPVGFPPDLRKYSGSALDTLMEQLLNSIRNSLSRSFFITLKMCSDLNRRDIRGVVPLLLLYASRTGHAVIKASPFNLDTNGVIVYADSFKQLEKQNPNRGVHIELVNKDGTHHNLYYIQFNAADGEISSNRGIQHFFAQMKGKIITMLKAASYLLHNDAFTKIRSIILERSDAILQDDSGMPFRFINDGAWSHKLYGRFCDPIESFAWINQPDLKKAYEECTPGAFPFTYGYGYGKTVLIARKNKSFSQK